MSYGKLVRDKIPKIIEDNGEKPIIRTLLEKEYIEELEKKLLEECNEVINSNGSDRLEELADVLEVLMALAKSENSSFEDVTKIADKKREKRGGFNDKIFLEGVE